jgi:hypothetical protein
MTEHEIRLWDIAYLFHRTTDHALQLRLIDTLFGEMRSARRCREEPAV